MIELPSVTQRQAISNFNMGLIRPSGKTFSSRNTFPPNFNFAINMVIP